MILEEAKAHLIVDHASDDALIDSLIAAVRQVIEEETGRSLVTQTRALYLDSIETAPPIVLPHGPVASVTGFDYWDLDTGQWTAVSTSAYYVSGDRVCVSETSGAPAWPVAERTYDAFRITYTAGYGAASDVPKPLKQAILLTIGDLYLNRETLVGAGLVVTNVPVSAKVLVQPYINYQIS